MFLTRPKAATISRLLIYCQVFDNNYVMAFKLKNIWCYIFIIKLIFYFWEKHKTRDALVTGINLSRRSKETISTDHAFIFCHFVLNPDYILEWLRKYDSYNLLFTIIKHKLNFLRNYCPRKVRFFSN